MKQRTHKLSPPGAPAQNTSALSSFTPRPFDRRAQLDSPPSAEVAADALGQPAAHMIANAPIRAQSLPAPQIQAKMTIGAPDDRHEQEADRVASQVVQQIHAPAITQPAQSDSVQRAGLPGHVLQPKRGSSSGGWRKASAEGEASADVAAAINRGRGGGQPLEAGLQQTMGQAMGADFSAVRVHTDAQSDQLNQSVQARAFTTGRDLFFRQGAYQPESRQGQELIAHELTHVVQQGAGAQGGLVQREWHKVKKQDGEFLGEPAAHHLHRDGESWEHYRFGNGKAFQYMRDGEVNRDGLERALEQCRANKSQSEEGYAEVEERLSNLLAEQPAAKVPEKPEVPKPSSTDKKKKASTKGIKKVVDKRSQPKDDFDALF